MKCLFIALLPFISANPTSGCNNITSATGSIDSVTCNADKLTILFTDSFHQHACMANQNFTVGVSNSSSCPQTQVSVSDGRLEYGIDNCLLQKTTSPEKFVFKIQYEIAVEGEEIHGLVIKEGHISRWSVSCTFDRITQVEVETNVVKLDSNNDDKTQISGVFETPTHPYAPDQNVTWNYKPKPGKFVKIWFDKLDTEQGNDGIAISSESGTNAFSGSDSSSSSSETNGNTGTDNTGTSTFENTYGSNYTNSSTWSQCTDQQVDFHFLSNENVTGWGYEIRWELYDDSACEVAYDGVEVIEANVEQDFQIQMEAFTDQSYYTLLNYPIVKNYGDELYFKISFDDTALAGQSANFHLITETCWATPDVTQIAETNVTLIENECESQLYGSILEIVDPRSNTNVDYWNSRVFRFPEEGAQVAIRCRVRICFDADDCERDCSGRRSVGKKRNGKKTLEKVISTGLITLGSTEESPAVRSEYVAFLAAVLGFCLI